jgi:hypothetical protein
MKSRSKTLAAGALSAAMMLAAGYALAASPSASVSVKDQKVTGDRLTIADATLPHNGYLAIHASDSKGNLSKKVLGYVPLKAGDHDNVKITLKQTPMAGAKLWAVLHNDNTRDKFEFGMPRKTYADMPMKARGKIIDESFKVL